MRRLLSRFRRDRRGVAAIEFAVVAPLLIMLMFGMIMYGSWFWMAHSVQAIASEGARAAIAGLDPAEREQLARALVGAQVGDLGLDASKAAVAVESTPSVIRVNIAYDASDHPLMALSGLIPSPPKTIRRTAVVRLGGY
ncbi:TadE/TadG family type IV pilus assembly protein [Brevundimonas sp. NPDC090276]|uniref:TadE/TadG family type IV pilus assembly protein n=1 Tax=Brevundimonas sp. NPDC090276 TaxID=3363956 RepID=UPI00383AE362